MSIQQILLAGGAPATEFDIYKARIAALGGSLNSTEDTYATNLINAIQAASYGSKIKYLLPFIGGNIAAHRVPLRDSLNVGAAGLTGPTALTNANCSTAGGLTNSTEQSGALDTKIKPSQLGTSNNGGIGWYERNWGAGSGVEPAGCYGTSNPSPDERYVLDLRSSMQRFRWGGVTNSQAGPGTTAANGHYYGQRSSSTLRRIYKDGTTLGTDGTASDSAARAGDLNIYALGCNGWNSGAATTYWKGRGACFYLTDGTLSDADVAAFHTLLGTYLITPTGR